MKIDKALLDELAVQAQASPRLRMNMDLRESPGPQAWEDKWYYLNYIK